MVIRQHLSSRVYPFFETMAEGLQDDRRTLPRDTREPNNMMIILCRACHVEGVMEEQAYRAIGYYRSKYRQVKIPEFTTRKPVNAFVNLMIGELETKVGRTTGVDNFATLFNSMLGGSMLSAPTVTPYAEGIRILFQLRNVIAHGRAVRASIQFRGSDLDSGLEDFAGGYSQAERYLRKVGIISTKFTSLDEGDWVFSDGVADHFSMISSQFLNGLIQYIDLTLAELDQPHD